ncbi:MAG: glycerol kinase GlpK [Clostridia bacterium]|nr:glycerol kinase GlpK [Clostridia bacterium]
MQREYILGIDQGSTGSKVIVVDREGEVVCSAYRRIESFYPQEGWLEHEPDEVWESVRDGLLEVAREFDMNRIRAIGVTNQRETFLLWDRATGKPLTRAISWQCTRGAGLIERWAPFADEILEKTGLISNSYFSASKIAWALENAPELRERAERGELCMGNLNTWIIWKLTEGRSHMTDSANAGRTMFYDVRRNVWDEELLRKMDIPASMLPGVTSCDGDFGMACAPAEAFETPIPIMASIGDQMSALFGQACFERGEAKCTIGTCINIVTYTGDYEAPRGGVLPAIAADLGGELTYELEGGIYVAGSVNEWLIEQLGIASTPQEVSDLAQSVESSNGACLVPAFQGLGAPHWDMSARALIIGMSRFHDKRHICRAALESLPLQTNDVIAALKRDFGIDVKVLRVDGGVARNDFAMQLFADITNCRVERPKNTDRTPMGAVYIAGLASGLWKDKAQLRGLWKLDRAFEPFMDAGARDKLLEDWSEAVRRSLSWAR